MAAVEKIHKNWLEIATEPDEALRLLLTEAEDSRILTGLQIGFPQFFSAELSAPPETEILPVSLLRTLSRKEARKYNSDSDTVEIDSEFDWHCVIPKIRPDIPLFQFEDPVPFQLRRQLKGQRVLGGMKVTYRSLRCIVVHAWTLSHDFGKVLTKIPELECLVLAPEKFFDLTK